MHHAHIHSGNIDFGRLSVRVNDSLRDLLQWFRQHPSMRLLAVVDENNHPVGVVREIDVRALLFNPFGHALMSNPGFGQDIRGLISECAVADECASDSERIAAYLRHADSPGLILTRNGQFIETLSNDRLVELMAAGRMARAERITENSEQFTGAILGLSERLTKAASRMQGLSESLVEQAGEMTDAAQNVAAGAAQSSVGLQDVNDRGRRLAEALEQLSHVASSAKTVRSRTHEVIEAVTPQMNALAASGLEIRAIIDVINNIGRKTNFLALNAQIEAVRQSENTNGFIAVANEIKQLAGQTRGSADEVSIKVDRIGKAVTDVLSGHKEIAHAMDSVSDISGRIDSAVEQHSATSLVVAGYVEQAADATQDISMRAQDIGKRAKHVSANAHELEQFSSMLLQSAHEISNRSQAFVEEIKYA
jgi:methyl-accepting chemotaxis protein